MRFSTTSSAIGTLTCRSPFNVSSPPVIRAYATSVRRSAACWRESRSPFSCVEPFKASSVSATWVRGHHAIRMIRARSDPAANPSLWVMTGHPGAFETAARRNDAALERRHTTTLTINPSKATNGADRASATRRTVAPTATRPRSVRSTALGPGFASSTAIVGRACAPSSSGGPMSTGRGAHGPGEGR